MKSSDNVNNIELNPAGIIDRGAVGGSFSLDNPRSNLVDQNIFKD